eukprot:gene6078-7572_t
MGSLLLKSILFISLVISACISTPVVYPYPLYKQCDSKWANDLIVSDTVCQVGCLMSSISMAIAGKGIMIDNQLSSPGSLNSWLKANQGYTEQNDLIESVIPGISPMIVWDGPIFNQTGLSMEEIRETISKPNSILILNVMNGDHFVLATGYDVDQPDLIYVNDPGFNNLYYLYNSSIVGYRLFTMY